MTKEQATAEFLNEISQHGSVGKKMNKSFTEYCRHRDHLAMSLGLIHDIDPREFLKAETDRMAAALCNRG